MKIRRHTILLLLFALLIGAGAQALNVGDPAPPLPVTTWIKNPQNTIYDGKKITVLEFWTTWCPACRSAIPTMTQLQAQYSKTVSVVAVSPEEFSVVNPFVTSPYRNMGYSVGLIDRSTLNVFGVGGYPFTMIVDQSGRVAWRGYMDEFATEFAQAVDAGVFFERPPASTILEEGDNFTLNVEMANDNPVTFSWTRNGTPVGGNSSTLTLSSVTEADEGTYRCTATKVGDPAISQYAESSIMVLSGGESLPAASPWSTALLIGILALGGASVYRRSRGKRGLFHF